MRYRRAGQSPRRTHVPGRNWADYGYYDDKNHELCFGSSSLENDGAREVVNTLAHERPTRLSEVGHRKSWRPYPDTEELKVWEASDKNYIRYEEDPVEYRKQPIEKDAWDYGDRIAERLYGAKDS